MTVATPSGKTPTQPMGQTRRISLSRSHASAPRLLQNSGDTLLQSTGRTDSSVQRGDNIENYFARAASIDSFPRYCNEASKPSLIHSLKSMPWVLMGNIFDPGHYEPSVIVLCYFRA